MKEPVRIVNQRRRTPEFYDSFFLRSKDGTPVYVEGITIAFVMLAVEREQKRHIAPDTRCSRMPINVDICANIAGG